MYPVEIVQPMKEELTENGFTELLNRGEVDDQLKKEGTTLVMINNRPVYNNTQTAPAQAMNGTTYGQAAAPAANVQTINTAPPQRSSKRDRHLTSGLLNRIRVLKVRRNDTTI